MVIISLQLIESEKIWGPFGAFLIGRFLNDFDNDIFGYWRKFIN